MARWNSWLRQQPSGTVTQTLVGLNVGVFLMQTFAPQLALVPTFALQPLTIAEQGEWWRLLTAAFLHGGWLHLAMNMLALWQIGSALEQMIGPSRFLTLYLVAALGGSIASYSLSDQFAYSVGASGAIFGLLTAFIVVGIALRMDVSTAVVFLVINVAISFSGGIDKWAHFGGAAIGAVVAWLFVERRKRGPKFDSTYYAVVASLIGLMLVAYFQRTNTLLGG